MDDFCCNFFSFERCKRLDLTVMNVLGVYLISFITIFLIKLLNSSSHPEIAAKIRGSKSGLKILPGSLLSFIVVGTQNMSFTRTLLI